METHNTEPFITPDIFRRTSWVKVLQSTRNGGVSGGRYRSLNVGTNTNDEHGRVRTNMDRLCAAAGIDPSRVVSAEQVHGTRVLHVREPGRHRGYDAFMTDTPGLFLAIMTADCFPVVVADTQHRAIAAIHAGWQGTANGIVPKTLAAMHEAFATRPAACTAWIGTGISAAHYAVGAEVAAAFPKESNLCGGEGNGSRFRLDIGAAIGRQLLGEGVAPESIASAPWCSFRDERLFFSYRRDQGDTGRMATLAGIIAQA